MKFNSQVNGYDILASCVSRLPVVLNKSNGGPQTFSITMNNYSHLGREERILLPGDGNDNIDMFGRSVKSVPRKKKLLFLLYTGYKFLHFVEWICRHYKCELQLHAEGSPAQQ